MIDTFCEKPLQSQGDRDVVSEPVGATTNLPEVIFPLGVNYFDRQIIDDDFDGRVRPFGV